MPNQYSAADLTNVPRGNQFTGYNPVGASGTVKAFNAYVGGLRTSGGQAYIVSDSTYPHTLGSFAPGEQQALASSITPEASGMFAPGSGLNVFTSVKFAVAEGTRMNVVDYPGYTPTGAPLNASGITHSYYSNPTALNSDPYLQSNV